MHPDSGSVGGTATTVAAGFGRGVVIFLTTFALVVELFFLFGAGEVFDDLDVLVDGAGLFVVAGC